MHANKKRGNVSKSINVGDEVLLRAEKSNKLSRNFPLSPFKVVRNTGSGVTVKTYTGVEFKRNPEFTKKCHAQEGLSHNADYGGSESACEGAGKAQDPGSSHAEENKEDEQVDVESEIRH